MNHYDYPLQPLYPQPPPSGRTTQTVLTIDCSGSMSERDYPPTRIEAAREAARRFIDVKLLTRPTDHVALVTFEGAPLVRFKMMAITEALYLFHTSGLSATGNTTDIAPALKLAKKLFRWRFGARQILVLTDGWSHRPFLEVGKKLKDSGVEIVVVGVGSRKEFNEADLRLLASPGRYFFVGDVEQLYALFEDIASDRIARL